MLAVMIRLTRLAPLAAMLIAAAPAAPGMAQAHSPASGEMPLTAEQRAAVRCSAMFAIVAAEQQRGDVDALALPPLGQRGREYFARTGAMLIDAGMSREQAAATLADAARQWGQEAGDAGDPGSAAAAVVGSCLTLLDAEVPPLASPTLAQCAAISALAWQEADAREGPISGGEELQAYASMLEARRRDALLAEGHTPSEADRILAEAYDAMLEETLAGGGAERYDVERCFDMARPETQPGEE